MTDVYLIGGYSSAFGKLPTRSYGGGVIGFDVAACVVTILERS